MKSGEKDKENEAGKEVDDSPVGGWALVANLCFAAVAGFCLPFALDRKNGVFIVTSILCSILIDLILIVAVAFLRRRKFPASDVLKDLAGDLLGGAVVVGEVIVHFFLEGNAEIEASTNFQYRIVCASATIYCITTLLYFYSPDYGLEFAELFITIEVAFLRYGYAKGGIPVTLAMLITIWARNHIRDKLRGRRRKGMIHWMIFISVFILKAFVRHEWPLWAVPIGFAPIPILKEPAAQDMESLLADENSGKIKLGDMFGTTTLREEASLTTSASDTEEKYDNVRDMSRTAVVPGEPALTTSASDTVEKFHSVGDMSRTAAVPGEPALTTSASDTKDKYDNVEDMSRTAAVPGELAFTTSASDTEEKYDNVGDMSRTAVVPGEPALTTSASDTVEKFDNVGDMSRTAVVPREPALTTSASDIVEKYDNVMNRVKFEAMVKVWKLREQNCAPIPSNANKGLTKTTKNKSNGKPPSAEENGKSPPVGLRNIGSTCYMSSAIPCLAHIPKLASYMSEHYMARDSTEAQEKIAPAFSKLLTVLLARGADAVDPTEFRTILQQSTKMFCSDEEEDFVEFLDTLLSYLNDDLKTRSEETIIEELFSGTCLLKYNCTGCDRVKSLQESFNVHRLPVPHNVTGHNFEDPIMKDATTMVSDSVAYDDTTEQIFYLENCLEAYFEEELVDMDCECSSKKARRTSTFIGIPQILVLQLKRFLNHGSKLEKDERFIEFPVSLNLSPYTTEKDSIYSLYAVGIHLGNSISKGHYKAYVLLDNVWYCFDDHKVSPVTEMVVLSTEAYVLFYKRGS